MDRRTFLALGAAALGLAGCTPQADAPRPTPPPATDPDQALRSRVALAEASLIAAYRQEIEAHPQLAEVLAPFLAHHEAHLARVAPTADLGALVNEAAGSGAASPGASGSGDGGPGASGSGDAGAGGVAVAIAGLAQAETRAAGERVTACDGVTDAGLARDLCLIAASEAQHAAVLDELDAADPGGVNASPAEASPSESPSESPTESPADPTPRPADQR